MLHYEYHEIEWTANKRLLTTTGSIKKATILITAVLTDSIIYVFNRRIIKITSRMEGKGKYNVKWNDQKD